MSLRLLCLVAGLGCVSCAGAGQTYSDANGGVIQVAVTNESVATITTYAVWDSNRIRLGEVGPNRQRAFITPVRGGRLTVGYRALGAPPAGTGDSRQEQYQQTNVLSVLSGDEIECTVSFSFGDCSLVP